RVALFEVENHLSTTSAHVTPGATDTVVRLGETMRRRSEGKCAKYAGTRARTPNIVIAGSVTTAHTSSNVKRTVCRFLPGAVGSGISVRESSNATIYT